MPQEVKGTVNKKDKTEQWEERFEGRMMQGDTYRYGKDGEETYLGKVLKQGRPLKTEILRGKDNKFTRRSLFGFETAAGDTTYHEFENTSQSMSILQSMEGLDMRSAMISGKPGVDTSGAKSGDDYVANWGTPPASSVTKDVTGKIMGFLKGLRK